MENDKFLLRAGKHIVLVGEQMVEIEHRVEERSWILVAVDAGCESDCEDRSSMTRKHCWRFLEYDKSRINRIEERLADISL